MYTWRNKIYDYGKDYLLESTLTLGSDEIGCISFFFNPSLP